MWARAGAARTRLRRPRVSNLRHLRSMRPGAANSWGLDALNRQQRVRARAGATRQPDSASLPPAPLQQRKGTRGNATRGGLRASMRR